MALQGSHSGGFVRLPSTWGDYKVAVDLGAIGRLAVDLGALVRLPLTWGTCKAAVDLGRLLGVR